MSFELWPFVHGRSIFCSDFFSVLVAALIFWKCRTTDEGLIDEDEKEDYEVRENVMDYDEEGAGNCCFELKFWSHVLFFKGIKLYHVYGVTKGKDNDMHIKCVSICEIHDLVHETVNWENQSTYSGFYYGINVEGFFLFCVVNWLYTIYLYVYDEKCT